MHWSRRALLNPPFVPTKLGGCVLWYRATNAIVSSGLITSLPELSGAGSNHDYTAAGAARPTFNTSDAVFGGAPSMTFDGAANYLTKATATVLPSGLTIFAVYKPDDANTTRTLFSDLNIGGTSLLWQTSSNYQYVDEAGNNSGNLPVTLAAQAHVLVATMTNGDQRVYLDAITTPVATTSLSWGTFTITQFGARNLTSFLKGSVTTMGVFNRVLPSPDRATLMRALGAEFHISIAA